MKLGTRRRKRLVMAQNSSIFVYYDGEIAQNSNGYYYVGEPAYLHNSRNMDYTRLCLEIYENIGWPLRDIISIKGRLPYLKGDELHFRLVKISNDIQLVRFAEHIKYGDHGWPEIEIYIERVRTEEFDIGTSSRSNVAANIIQNESLEPTKK